ncbi:PHP domain-containing protein [Thermodesulfobacteriota bacterium]
MWLLVRKNKINRIVFEKPDLPNLTRQNTVVDMHFHSIYSDGRNSVDEIVEYAEMLGIGVAITDHNAIQGAVEIDAHKNVLSIPGIEVTSCEGTHLLVYFYDIESLCRFYDENVAPHMGREVMSSIDLSMEDIIGRANNLDAITIFPHPFCGIYTGIATNHHFQKKCLNKLFQKVDGVEVINSENVNKWNLKSALLGFNLNKAISGGSDGHSLYQLGRVVTYAACTNDRQAFLSAVKNGRNKVVGKEIAILRKVQSSGIKLRSNLKNYPDLMEKNFSYGRKVIHIKSKTFRDRVKTRISDGIRNMSTYR